MSEGLQKKKKKKKEKRKIQPTQGLRYLCVMPATRQALIVRETEGTWLHETMRFSQ